MGCQTPQRSPGCQPEDGSIKVVQWIGHPLSHTKWTGYSLPPSLYHSPETSAPPSLQLAVHLLSGSLPAPTLLHQHQFTLLHMVTLLGPGNTLYQHALYMLHHSVPNSWFSCIHQTAVQYSLPDPLQILVSPPPKLQYKSKSRLPLWNTAMIHLPGRLLPSLVFSTSVVPSFLLELVLTLCGGLVDLP